MTVTLSFNTAKSLAFASNPLSHAFTLVSNNSFASSNGYSNITFAPNHR